MPIIELNKIYNEYCLITMSKISEGFVDFILTSPPYDNLRPHHTHSFDFEPIAEELYRVLRKGGVMVWVVSDATKNMSESGTSFKRALYFMDVGFKLYDTMIYRKTNYIPKNHRRYEQCFEYMFVLSKGRPRTFNPIMIDCKYAGDATKNRDATTYKDGKSDYPVPVWNDKSPINDKKIASNIWAYAPQAGIKGHPSQFPEQLANDQIISWTNEQDVIYDPFMGAGTTAKMAILNNRQFIGSEISEKYCKLAEKRMDFLLQF